MRSAFILPLLSLGLAAPALRPVPSLSAPKAAQTFPGKTWERVASPEAVGFSSARLDALGAWLKSVDTTAMHISVGGKTLFEFGDVSHQSYLASARKSVLATLYGKYVANGTIPLQKTLRELGFEDVGGLQPRELDATIEHIISARSGIYHPASNPGDFTSSAPPRGSQKPGEYYLYNNWDFNAAGAIFEKLTGKDVFEALDADLAKPIGMQDFNRAIQQKTGDTTRSKHLAYHMTFSTRDMARLGLLVARGGNWKGTQVVPDSWVQRMTSLVTPFHGMNPPSLRSLASGGRWGYGYMWWVWDAPGDSGPFNGAYSAMGAFGQFITVLPALDMVVTHKTDPRGTEELPRDRPHAVSAEQYTAILHMILAARLAPGESAQRSDARSPAEQAALDLLRSGHIQEGSRALLSTHAAHPLPRNREEGLNLMAYRFMNQKQLPEALAVFDLVTRVFPQSANAWDSLGECALATGDKAKAVKAYSRSLELVEGDSALSPDIRTQLQESARRALATLKP